MSARYPTILRKVFWSTNKDCRIDDIEKLSTISGIYSLQTQHNCNLLVLHSTLERGTGYSRMFGFVVSIVFILVAQVGATLLGAWDPSPGEKGRSLYMPFGQKILLGVCSLSVGGVILAVGVLSEDWRARDDVWWMIGLLVASVGGVVLALMMDGPKAVWDEDRLLLKQGRVHEAKSYDWSEVVALELSGLASHWRLRLSDGKVFRFGQDQLVGVDDLVAECVDRPHIRLPETMKDRRQRD